jgi:hypothetical protein
VLVPWVVELGGHTRAICLSHTAAINQQRIGLGAIAVDINTATEKYRLHQRGFLLAARAVSVPKIGRHFQRGFVVQGEKFFSRRSAQLLPCSSNNLISRPRKSNFTVLLAS